MSSAPVGTSWPLISWMACAKRRAMGTPARPDANERQFLDTAVTLENLVRDARQGSPHPISVHYDRHCDTFG